MAVCRYLAANYRKQAAQLLKFAEDIDRTHSIARLSGHPHPQEILFAIIDRSILKLATVASAGTQIKRGASLTATETSK